MYIILNDKPYEYHGEPTLANLITHLKLSHIRIVVLVNSIAISCDGYAVTMLKNGDNVDIITAVGGG